MARISLPVDLVDVEAGGKFETLPAATYSLRIENIVEKIGADSQAPYLVLTHEVIDDPDFAGRKLWDNISLQEQALFKLKQLSISAGIDISREFDTEEFLGAVVLAVVDLEKSNKNDEDGNPIMRNVIRNYKEQPSKKKK